MQTHSSCPLAAPGLGAQPGGAVCTRDGGPEASLASWARSSLSSHLEVGLSLQWAHPLAL